VWARASPYALPPPSLRILGVVADAENLLSGGRETFGGKKRVRAESEKKNNNNNKGRLPGNANENPTRFMPHVTSKPRVKIKATTQLHLFFCFFIANPSKILRRGLVRRYFPRRKLRSSYLRTHQFGLRKTWALQNNNTICGFCGNLLISLATRFSLRIIYIIQELSKILKIRERLTTVPGR